MNPPQGWTLFTDRCLRAHFLQPDGSSRQGADWAVTLSLGREQHAIYVRAYADDIAPGTTTERESQLILAYVARQIESGWRPSGQKGESGRLVYAPAPAGTDAAPPDKPGSWWRFTSGRDNPPLERTGE